MIVDIFNNAARRIVENMVIATLPKINVKSGKCRYNFRCQMNAVHDALNSGQDKIAIMFKFSTNVIILSAVGFFSFFSSINDETKNVCPIAANVFGLGDGLEFEIRQPVTND